MPQDQNFQTETFDASAQLDGEYDGCSFVGCMFTEVDLSDIMFLDCTFRDCIFSMVNLKGTCFRDVQFEGCKLMGLRFDELNTFLMEMRFERCQLNLSSFFRLDLTRSSFNACNLNEVDFVESNLSGLKLHDCDLEGAMFENTLLEKADLSKASNYQINPQFNEINGARFSREHIHGLLAAYAIEIV